MKLNLFRVIVPVLLVFIQPLEAQTLISTPNLRQGESTFALFLNTSPQLKNSSISSSIRAVKANTEISAEAWKPAEGAWHQTGYTATIRYKDASLGSVFLGFALPKDPGILPGNYWDYVSISGMGQEVQARWDIGLGAVLFLLGVPVNAQIGRASCRARE